MSLPDVIGLVSRTFRFLASLMSSWATGGYQKAPPWSKDYGGYYDKEYNYNQNQKYQQFSYYTKRAEDWYSNKRKKNRQRGREYVFCADCDNWDWASAWFPKCLGCGKPWSKPGEHRHDDPLALAGHAGQDGNKDKAKGASPEEREQAAVLCKALSEALGTDLSGLLAKHLPAVQPPKSEKEQENQVWIELRDARRTVDRTAGKLRQSTKNLEQLREKLAAEEKFHNDLVSKNQQAEEKRHDLLQSYFASYGRDCQERAEEEAGIREPKRRRQGGGLDDHDHDPMRDLDSQENQEEQAELPEQVQNNGWRAARSRSPIRGSASDPSAVAGAGGMGNNGGIAG